MRTRARARARTRHSAALAGWALLGALTLPPLVAAQAPAGPVPTAATPETPEQKPPAAPAAATAAAPGAAARSEHGAASAVATIVLDTEVRERPPDHDAEPAPEPARSASLLHGFRLGYVFVANHDEPTEPGVPESSLAARHGIENPHHFLLGYEVMNRMAGSGWLNVLLIGNVSITGLEQSKLFPSANLLLGFELDRSFQAGVGINLMPVDDKPAHMIVAAGWTPRAGDVYLPLHVFLIPDIDSNHRLGTTFGVNWEI